MEYGLTGRLDLEGRSDLELWPACSIPLWLISFTSVHAHKS